MKGSAAGRASGIGPALATALPLAVGDARAHGERPSGNPWVEGAGVVFAEPACLMVVLVLALLLAQPGRRPTKSGWWAAAAGLPAGLLAAAAGLALDLTVPLLVLCLGIGVLVAWARPAPAALHTALAVAAAVGVVLMSAPAVSADPGLRWRWLAGAVLATVLLFASALALSRALLGRRPGQVRRMLLRVFGSWFTAAATLALVLQLKG